MRIISGDVWKKVNSRIINKNRIEAAIAYVTSTNLKLKKNDILICDASIRAISNGETKATTLDFYYKKGVILYSKKNLHAKVLWTKNFVIIGSANLSNNSARYLFEASIYLIDKTSINQVAAFIYLLKKKLRPLNEAAIAKLKDIPVVKRLPPFTGERKQIIEMGDNNWIMPSYELSEKIIKAEEVYTDSKTKEVARRVNLSIEDVLFMRCTGKEKLATKGRPGDQLMQLYKDLKNKKITVISFCPILDVERKNGVTWLYYDARDQKEISWALFNKKAGKMNLDRSIGKNSYRTISDNDSILLNTIF